MLHRFAALALAFVSSAVPGCANRSLYSAVAANDLSTARALLAEGAPPNYDFQGNTPLTQAIVHRNYDMISLLLQSGADANKPTSARFIPILLSTHLGDVRSTGMLLDAGAGIEQPNMLGMTPLMIAAKYGHIELTNMLIQRGAAVTARDTRSRTPLIHGAANKREIVETLVRRGADVNEESKDEDTPLLMAARFGTLPTVAFLVERGADKDYTTRYGLTPFALACLAGKADVALYLREQGATTMVLEQYPEISARMHHILADHTLAQGDLATALIHYKQARADYETAIADADNQIAGIAMAQVLTLFATVAVNTLSAYQAELNGRQLAQVAALRHASDSGTGYAGYNAYMRHYDKAYRPSYSVESFLETPVPPPDAPLEVQKHYQQVRRERLATLEQTTERAIACWDRSTAGSGLYDCVGNAGRSTQGVAGDEHG